MSLSGHFSYSYALAIGDELAMFRAMLDHLPVGITVFDREFRLSMVNRLAIDMLDFPVSMFEADLPTLQDLTLYNARRGEYGPGDPYQQTRERMALARQGSPHRFHRTRPNGRVIEIIGSALPLGGFISIYTDITDSKQIETTLRNQTLYLNSVLDHLPQGITVFDAQLKLKCWNSTVLNVLNLPPEGVYQDVLFADLIMYPALRGEYGPGDPAELVEQRRAMALKFQAHRFERVRPNGRTHLVEGRPMLQDGQTVGFVTSYTDITENKQHESALAEKTELLQTLIDNLPSGISVYDKHQKLVLMNEQAERLLGLPHEMLVQTPDFFDQTRWNAERGEFGDVDVEQYISDLRARIENLLPYRSELLRANGKVIDIRRAPMPHGGFVSVYTDITEQKIIERELRQQREVFQTLVDNIPGGVTLFGPDQQLLVCNAEFARLLEFPPELFEGQPTLERFFRFNAERGEYGRGDTQAQVQHLLALAQRGQAHLFKRTRPNGTILEVRGLPIADGSFVTIYTDVTEQQQAVDAIERLAHHDALTGLANRHTLEARLDQLVADAKRHDRHLAVMFLDMDNFKSINDTLGHSVGDQFLCKIAQRLSETMRDNDIVARLGGDEFVVVLADIVDAQDAAVIASKIIDKLSQPALLGSHSLRASVSIGICFYPQDGQDRGTLMQSADIAMYHAKNAGKGVFHFFNQAMMTAAAQRLELERDLRQALALQQFVLHYQPQVETTGQHATGVEALIRWQKPSGELVPPNAFIGLAEELGLINEIGDWALRTACHTMVRWRLGGLLNLTMAVNLSAVQLRNAHLPQSIAAALHDSGLPSHILSLEITESVAMQDPQASIERLGLIRALGVRLAIDDFGTGYSSLAYLKRLPVDYLKLDRAFVQDLENDSNDAAICAATIGLAHHLGFAVIAEGVETQGQCQYLASQGCDVFQGYYFSRPLPEAAAYAWLAGRAG